MAAQTFSIDFSGYRREVDKGSISSKSGIYCIYSCTYNKDKDNVSINKLIYIGESQDVNNRIDDHEKLSKWKKHLKSGEILCYSFGGVVYFINYQLLI